MQKNIGDDAIAALFDTYSSQEPHDEFPKPDIGELEKKFIEAATICETARNESREDARYYHGPGQLDAEVRQKLRERRQPATYYNRISPAVDNTMGVLAQAETTVQADGRNDPDDPAATIATQVLRFQAQKGRFDLVKRAVAKNTLIYGIGAAIVEVGDDDTARVSSIEFDQFYYDPASRREDFKDASYLIRAKWWDSWRLKKRFLNDAPNFDNSFSGWSGVDIVDQPERNLFLDRARNRVLVVELYHEDEKTNRWMRSVFCKGTVLEHGPTGYLDERGRDVCPIEAIAFKVDQDWQRYGLIRNMRPVQHSINSRASRMLMLTTASRLRQIEQGTPVSSRIAAKEAAKADGVIPWGYQTESNSVSFQENLQILQHDIALLDRFAPNQALVGRAGGANTSGKAHQIMASAGFNELADAMSNFEDWEQRCYTQMWWRSKQFLTDRQLIHITDDGGARQKLMVNEPVMGMVPVTGPDGQPVIDPRTGQPAMQLGQVGVNNHLAEMDVDLTIELVQDAENYRQAALDRLFEASAKTGISLLDPQFEFVIQILNFPGRDWILSKWQSIRDKAMQQQAAQQAPQQQQAAQQAQAQAALTQSKTDLHNAQAQKDQAMALKHAEEARLLATDHAMKNILAAEAMRTHGGLLNAMQNGPQY